MTSSEHDIAWLRQKAAETLAAIEQLSEEPDSPSQAVELQILTEALGRYVMTAESLEALRLPPPLKTLAWCVERRSEVQAEIDRMTSRPPKGEELERIVRLSQELRQIEDMIGQLQIVSAPT